MPERYIAARENGYLTEYVAARGSSLDINDAISFKIQADLERYISKRFVRAHLYKTCKVEVEIKKC